MCTASGDMDAASIEQGLRREGAELRCLLMQHHLNWRDAAEVVGPVVGRDGRERSLVRQCTERNL